MTWDPVPFFVQQKGAAHSPEVFRQQLYIATGGAEGIAEPADLKVVPLTVPGTQVQVRTGGALILNRAQGGAQQTYSPRNPTVDVVDVAETGSSGGRSDLVVAQIEDPGMAGEPWDPPEDPANAQYVFTRIIENVPAGTTRLQDVPGYEGRTAITLARIDLPKNTATITAAMITDLRKIARPRQSTEEYTDFGKSTATLSSLAGILFPPYAPSVPVPSWATHVRITVEIAQLQALGNSTGYGNVQGRDTSGNTVVDGDTVSYNFDAVVTSTRGVYIASTYGDVRALRGKTLKPSSLMRKSGANQADLKYDDGAQMLWRITFYERIV